MRSIMLGIGVSILLAGFNAAAASTSVEGCYKALEVDGRPVTSPDFDSTIELVNGHMFYANMDGSEIDTLIIQLAIKFPNGNEGYRNIQVIREGAEISETDQEIRIFFRGQIRNKWSNRVKEIKEVTTFKKNGDVFEFATTLQPRIHQSARLQLVSCRN